MFLYVLLIIVICLATIRKRGKDEKPLSGINTTIINGEIGRASCRERV